MTIFLDPTGNTNYGIGICARCSRKFFLHQLFSDPNSPGLKVCIDDLDQYDPYRLPARQTENINLPFTRPDVPLDGRAPSVAVVDETIVMLFEDGDDMLFEDDDEMLVEESP